MRIIAGEFRSRVIKTLQGDQTRPTQDKIKEAIFSRIGPYFDGGCGLDLFAGSGAVGLEARSRGLDKVYFSDVNYPAVQIIKENISILKVSDQCEVFKLDAMLMLKKMKELNVKLDFVFIDPPYKLKQVDEILKLLVEYDLLNEYADVVCESLKEDTYEDAYDLLTKTKETIYGITKITYYKNKKESI